MAFIAGWRSRAAATALRISGRTVILTPSVSPIPRSASRIPSRLVTSASSTRRAWGIVDFESDIFRAAIRRFPRKGIRSSSGRGVPGAVSGAGFPGRPGPRPAAARTSRSVTRPPWPVPLTEESSTPRSLASFRTAGTASASPRSGGAAGVFDGATTSSTAITSPTFTTCPGCATIRETVPETGEGISTFALSVSTSTRRSSSATRSPSETSQRTISPSAIPSPTSGSRSSNSIGSPYSRNTTILMFVISSTANRTPSRPRPLILFPP